MRIGGYEIMAYSSRNPPGGEGGRRYLDSLERLCEIVGPGIRWAVTGGLAIPLCTGTFRREHSDIDVAVPAEDFPAFSRRLEQNGYVLGRKRASAKISSSTCAEVYARMRPEDIVERKVRKVKLIDTSREGILRTVHTFPYERENGKLSYFDPEVSLRVDGDFTTTVPLNGRSIEVVSLRYVRALKELMPPHEKHARDLELLATLGDTG